MKNRFRLLTSNITEKTTSWIGHYFGVKPESHLLFVGNNHDVVCSWANAMQSSIKGLSNFTDREGNITEMVWDDFFARQETPGLDWDFILIVEEPGNVTIENKFLSWLSAKPAHCTFVYSSWSVKTNSRSLLNKLHRKAGYEIMDVYGALPGLNKANCFVLIDASKGRKWCIEHMFPVDRKRFASVCRQNLLKCFLADSRKPLIMPPRVVFLAPYLPDSSGSDLKVFASSVLKIPLSDIKFNVRLGTGIANSKTTFAVFAGDPSPAAFVKIAGSDAAVQYLINQKDTLEILQGYGLDGVRLPRVLYSGWWNNRYLTIESNALSDPQTRQTHTLGKEHYSWFYKVQEMGGHISLLSVSPLIEELNVRVRTVLSDYPDVVGKISDTVKWVTTWSRGIKVLLGLCHRDFDKKNILLGNNDLVMIDWEWARWEWPLIFDIFNHSIFSSYRNDPTPDKVLLEIESLRDEPLFRRWLKSTGQNLSDGEFFALFSAYILDRFLLSVEVGKHGKSSEKLLKWLEDARIKAEIKGLR